MDPLDTRTAILDAAQEWVQKIGINAMSYQHISDAVGIRKASVHHHFPTKEALVEAVIDRYATSFLRVVDRILARDEPAKAKLRRYASLFESTLKDGADEKACPCAMLGAELATLGQRSAGMIREFYRENEERIAKILEQGVRDRSLRIPGSPARTAALIFALLEGGMLVVRAAGGRKHFALIVDELFELVSR
jgi:TetR/AcrR family transcriptional repressor of nem operon